MSHPDIKKTVRALWALIGQKDGQIEGQRKEIADLRVALREMGEMTRVLSEDAITLAAAPPCEIAWPLSKPSAERPPALREP